MKLNKNKNRLILTLLATALVSCTKEELATFADSCGESQASCAEESTESTSTESTNEETDEVSLPLIASVSINNSSVIATSSNVTLNLSASGASQVYVTESAGCASGGAWQSYQTSISLTLSQSTGTVPIYVKTRNDNGDESSCKSTTIHLLAGNQSHRLSSGMYSSCYVTSSGNVACWGYNATGQLGDNSTTTSTSPKYVKDFDTVGRLENAVAVAVGGGASDAHACALLDDTTVACWGANTNGQLGNPVSADVLVPIRVVSTDGSGTLSGVTAITAGAAYTCALTDTNVYCWGANNKGQLGDGTTTASHIPVAVRAPNSSSSMNNALMIDAGWRTACALLSTGQIACWGSNSYQNLADEYASSVAMTPYLIPGIGDTGVMNTATSISAGAHHRCFLTITGESACTGVSWFGELGDGSTTDRSYPEFVRNSSDTGSLASIASIHSGYSENESMSCGITDDNKLYCWGGDNTVVGRGGSPGDVTLPGLVEGVGGGGTLSNAIAVSVGEDFACALLSTEQVACWGYDFYGVLGGLSGDHNYPDQINAPID